MDDKNPGVLVAKIELLSFQTEIEKGRYFQAMASIFMPEIKIQKEQTKLMIQALSERIAKEFSEILDFDNQP